MIELAWWLLVLVVLGAAIAAAVLGAALAYRAGFAAGSDSGARQYAAPLAAAEAEGRLLREQVGAMRADEEAENATVLAIAPLQSALARVERQVETLERDRSAQFGELGERLREVSRATTTLTAETATLAGSLNASTIRGAWGETQLRRVLEHGGLLARCHFDEQVAARTSHDAVVRPDVVVRLPGERSLVIDAKAPLAAFLAAQAPSSDGADRARHLEAHAAHLRKHATALAGKEYWTAFESAPEMVVCFVPGDAILAAALDADPALFDDAMAKRVVLASPSTLLALVRTVAYTWKQDSLTANARELLTLGTELHARIRTLATHLDRMGGSLRRSVESYNSLVGTLETRVLVTARRMDDLGLASEPVPTTAPLDATTRPFTAPELLDELISGEDSRDEAYLAIEGDSARQREFRSAEGA